MRKFGDCIWVPIFQCDAMSKLTQKQQLNQKLNPRQILEATLFQLNSFSMEQRIYQELEKNPLLELSDPSENDLSDTAESSASDSEDFEIDELYSNTDDFELSSSKGVDQDILENTAFNKSNEIDRLKIEIQDLNLNLMQQKIAYDILDNLDQKGYLAIEPILIADRFDIDLSEVVEIQSQIKLLDPPGIASFDIRECLLSQLEFHNYKDSNAYSMIHDYFDDFSKANYEKISSNLEIDKERIKEALDILSNLYLYPLDNTAEIAKETILPDLMMEKRGDDWVISVNDSSMPELILNNKYSNMIDSKKIGSSDRSFIKKNYQGAQIFLDAVKQRNKTMILVMEKISSRQLDYFNSDRKVLKPMILQDIAEDLSIDISTVSRICNGKHVQLPWGIFELRSFFSEGVKMKDGSFISNTILKEDIINIIRDESVVKPLKDEDITEILNNKGYDIARRTVTKYRDKINIPNYTLRKKIKGLQK